MKYKKYFSFISQNSQLQPMRIKAILLSVFVLGLLLNSGCAKSPVTSDSSSPEQSVQDNHAEMLRMESEYNTLLSQYNSAVDDYNSKADIINSFIDKMDEYYINNLPEHISEQSKNTQGFGEFKNSNQDFSKLNADIDHMVEQTSGLNKRYGEICQLAYDSVITDYNTLAKAYNELVSKTAIDYILNLRSTVILKHYSSVSITNNYTETDLINDINAIIDDTQTLAADYTIVSQIHAPSEQWVIMRLNAVKGINGKQAVSKDNDPNGLLGKSGGYSSCVYFTVNNIDSDSIPGDSIVAKGTDAGGAIEVYPNLKSAKNRCDYLSQYDNTLLYSGSYVLVGTMVVRTSYKLTNQEQVALTSSIIQSFTALKENS